ncbi:MAG: hypothetical protein Q4C17_04520 [Bacillota bacterium]|nr:hypothetical protein [Bacillota bacterium]
MTDLKEAKRMIDILKSETKRLLEENENMREAVRQAELMRCKQTPTREERWQNALVGETRGMKFIEIDDQLVNLDNVADVRKSSQDRIIRICFVAGGYIDITKENEEELNKVWEWLKEVCEIKEGE